MAALYELQQVDTALARTVAHRQTIDNGTAQRAALLAATERLEGIRHELAGHQSRLRTLDLEIQSVQAKRSKVTADMYSGRIGNPKELASMQEEVEALGRQQAAVEDRVLVLLEQVEQLDPRAREAQRTLEEAEAALTRQEEAFREAAAAADREIRELTARRAEFAAAIDEDLLRRYERLREHKGGVAVVAVHNGVCDGCHVTIPERLVSRLRKDPSLVAACDGCGRLLVVR